MAMTPLGGFGVNVWLRIEGIGIIAIGTVGMSIAPEIIAMVAVTPPGRLDIAMRLKSNPCQDRDQRESRGSADASQKNGGSQSERGWAHNDVSAGKDNDLRTLRLASNTERQAQPVCSPGLGLACDFPPVGARKAAQAQLFCLTNGTREGPPDCCDKNRGG
jgi:hypothetical protein